MFASSTNTFILNAVIPISQYWPEMHQLIIYYVAFLAFVIPFEILSIAILSKELTGKIIPDHLSAMFVFCPPHSSELEEFSNEKGKKKKTQTRPNVFKRIFRLTVELFRLVKLAHPMTLFTNFMWVFISFTYVCSHYLFHLFILFPFLFSIILSYFSLTVLSSFRFPFRSVPERFKSGILTLSHG